jgi:hypothetical protein
MRYLPQAGISMRKLWKWWISPQIHANFHLVLTLTWIIMIVPTLLWWTQSVPYLVFMSLYAIITGHFSSYEATRAEIITKRQIEGEFDDMQSDEQMEDFLERKRNES